MLLQLNIYTVISIMYYGKRYIPDHAFYLVMTGIISSYLISLLGLLALYGAQSILYTCKGVYHASQ